MIGPDWVRTMARYNAWQNEGLRAAIPALAPLEAMRDRGAFFGSILGTANHLLWADAVWMSRFTGTAAPSGGTEASTRITPDVATWAAGRAAMDDAIGRWADGLADCDGEIAWHSGVLGRDVTRPAAVVYTHFFNHQTHHRGQLHAMLTAAGVGTGDTDLIFMPEGA